MDIKFYKQITKIGNSAAILIPKAIADLLDKDTVYCFKIEEAENGKETSASNV